MNRQKHDELTHLIKELKTLAIQKKRPLWKTIATALEGPTRQKKEVNVFKLSKYAKENEIIIVPGKVLGSGAIEKKISVAALSFSQGAVEKIRAQKGEVFSIKELMQKNPDGKGIRIMG